MTDTQKQQHKQVETTSQQQQEDNADSSQTDSFSIIKLDELNSIDSSKHTQITSMDSIPTMNQPQQAHSLPAFEAGQLEKSQASSQGSQLCSLPTQVEVNKETQSGDKENLDNVAMDEEDANIMDDFQVVDMEQTTDLMGPSLPPPNANEAATGEQAPATAKVNAASVQAATGKAATVDSINLMTHRQVLGDSNQQLTGQYPSRLGDSLIEMIINLRSENQNLVQALEANNEYMKERLNEFKREQEESKKREAQFAADRADYEHIERKLQRQNKVLSERLKNMETKLKDLKLEVSESLNAASSSKNSSLRGDAEPNLYPQLADAESFGNSALMMQNNQTETMQMDAANSELLNDGDKTDDSETDDDSSDDSPTAPPAMEFDAAATSGAQKVAEMSREELSKRFDANKMKFYAMDDPMKQCDELEKQLNDIGKRDYEICLLQQQLNIYRQDFRLERMAKLEAKIQIEKLKNDIDKLCLDRLEEQKQFAQTGVHFEGRDHGRRHSRHRSSIGGVRLDPAVAAAEAVMGKLSHKLSKKAAKTAARAAKYAAKQAHKDEKAATYEAAKAAAVAAAANGAGSSTSHPGATPNTSGAPEHHGHSHHHHHHRRHSHHNKPRGPSVRSEVVNDLLSTANKAMLTGYKMASTHVNLALDKLSAFEQAQASHLAANNPQAAGVRGNQQRPSAPMEHPSVD